MPCLVGDGAVGGGRVGGRGRRSRGRLGCGGWVRGAGSVELPHSVRFMLNAAADEALADLMLDVAPPADKALDLITAAAAGGSAGARE